MRRLTQLWGGGATPVVLIADVDVGLGLDERLHHTKVTLEATHMQGGLLPEEFTRHSFIPLGEGGFQIESI